MKESRAKKEVMFQSKASNRDVCPAGGWQRVRTQILPTWQRQEVQKKGRGEQRDFCQIYGVSEGQAQGKMTHHIPSPIRRERVTLPGDHGP